ncbi:MAG TPA: glycosyltransferase family 1 protein [Chloroflexia bacterium]|nr:glycosyltransferase family 1 protein [Chloroflexia bacterium]
MRTTHGTTVHPHVVFDGRYIQDRYHGIGRYAFHLLQEAAACAPGLRFGVLRDPALPDTRFDWSGLLALPNVSVEEVNAPLFGAREQIALTRTLGAHRGALYHTPYFALPWLLPTRGLVTVHDCIFEHDPRYMPKRWARAYYHLLMTASLSRARAVFVPSRATAADVRRFYGVRPGKMVITPEAADETFYPVEDPATLVRVREKYNLPPDFVLAVGARRPHKNFARLVEAVERLGDVEGATLVFVGEADERFPDEAAAAARSMGKRVRFIGKVPEADLPVLYSLATVFACPSLIEGFGLPVLEAMASGTPVVCSDIPVFREVAGDAAVTAPPDDTGAWASALRRVLSDPDLRDRLSRAGLTRASRFNWQRAAEAALRVYRRLGAPAPPAAE